MKIVLASSNEHKVKEINAIVKGSGIEFILPPAGFNPVEDGNTFAENSYIKAKAAWELTKDWTLADDSGLCIDALGGKPGIFSARYADTASLRIDRVLEEMKGVTDRKAHFECAMTLINPSGEKEFACTGICCGSIIKERRGAHGFGYDPIFLVEGLDKTMAELTDDEKNSLSHRARALKQIEGYLLSKQVYDNIK